MVKKILATIISCFILVGLMVIYYWHDIQYQPESPDLIHYFLILPIVITMVLLSPWLLYTAYQHHQQKKQHALQSEQDAEQHLSEALPTVMEGQWLTLNLYGAGAYSALGENDAILQGIQSFTSPQLDFNLLNLYGLPILSYRIAALDEQLQGEDADKLHFLSSRQQRIMALIHQQIEQHTELLSSIVEHLKQSSLFYESQHLHEYRMHPAWVERSFREGDQDLDSTQTQVEQVDRLDRFNLHIFLSEDVTHTWNDVSSNESIQAALYELGILPQQLHIEYHYLSATSTTQYLLELLERIQNQTYEISLIIAGDSEINQDIIDEKLWEDSGYIPAEFVSSFCLANPALQLTQRYPLKTFRLVAHQNHLDQLLKELDMHDLPQYQAEAPFVLVLEDGTAIKAVKKLEQFFAGSPVEQHHYLYCKPVAGHTQNLAKIFGLMLGAHWPNRQVVFIYEDNFKAFIQDFPEMA